MSLYLRDGREQDRDIRQMEEKLERIEELAEGLSDEDGSLDTSGFPDVGDEKSLKINKSMKSVDDILNHLANLELSGLKSSEYTSDNNIETNSLASALGSNDITLTLPAAEDGDTIVVKNETADNSVTVNAPGGSSIDNQLSYVLEESGDAIYLVGSSDGSWKIASDYKKNPASDVRPIGEAILSEEYELPSYKIKISMPPEAISITDSNGGSLPLSDTYRNGEWFDFKADEIGLKANIEVLLNGLQVKADNVIIYSQDTIEVDLSEAFILGDYLLYYGDKFSIN